MRECMMNEGERKTLRAWMEGKGLRALMARIFELVSNCKNFEHYF